jgi:hypothetical protein
MKTAIEWYYNEMVKFEKGNSEFFSSAGIYNHAFRMEKEQIIDAYNHNMTGFDKLEQEEIGLNWAEDYYNQTYNQNK